VKRFIAWAVVIGFILLLTALDGIIGGGVAAAEPSKGWASRYDCTAGYCGQPTVALPAELGGHYDGSIYAYATVCADRCATVPAVDFCLCHVEPSSHPDRIVDLNAEAWALVTDTAMADPVGVLTVVMFTSAVVVILVVILLLIALVTGGGKR
jgi:hypothetical protein